MSKKVIRLIALIMALAFLGAVLYTVISFLLL